MVETITAAIESVMTTPWIYPLVSFLVFFDAIIPAFPSEVPLNLTGAWAGATGRPDAWGIFLAAFFGAVIGDNVCYFLGTRLMGMVQRVPRGSKRYGVLQWVRRTMRRGAGATIIIARFIPSARFFMTILLGSMRFNWPTFFFFDSIGVALWAAQGVAIGYVGGMAFSETPLIGSAVGVAVGVGFGLLIQKLQNRVTDWWDTRRGYAETP